MPFQNDRLNIQVLSLEEVADLLEANEPENEADFGAFKAIKLSSGNICITSHGDRHLLICAK